MSDITVFQTAILSLLDDPSAARYTTDQVDQALRQALAEYSEARPLVQTYNVDGTGTTTIEMPADFQPMYVCKVELHDESADPQRELTFSAIVRDGSWFIELGERKLAASESIDVSYAAPHSIDGLDGAAGTTIPEDDEPEVQLGAAGFAAMARAFSRAESVNLQPDVAEKLLKLATACLEIFRLALGTRPYMAFGALPEIPTDKF